MFSLGRFIELFKNSELPIIHDYEMADAFLAYQESVILSHQPPIRTNTPQPEGELFKTLIRNYIYLFHWPVFQTYIALLLWNTNTQFLSKKIPGTPESIEDVTWNPNYHFTKERAAVTQFLLNVLGDDNGLSLHNAIQKALSDVDKMISPQEWFIKEFGHIQEAIDWYQTHQDDNRLETRQLFYIFLCFERKNNNFELSNQLSFTKPPTIESLAKMAAALPGKAKNLLTM